MHPRYLVATLAILVSAESASAQRPLTLSIGGGASLPLGRFEEGASIGWHALASVGWSTLMQPIGLRVDAHHNRFTAKAAGPDQAVTSATLNLSYRLPMTNSPLSPFIIVGGGGYRFECFGGTDCGTATRVGWNAGLGTKFAAFRLKGFVEARWHAVNADAGNVRFVPITFALTF
jgi:opacity protein-like surface antigen